jgi:MFS family permease
VLTLPRRLGLTLGTTQVLAWATTYYIPATMLGTVGANLGASRAVLLGAFSWALIISALCAPRVGRIIDAQGGRNVMVAGAIVTAVGLVALAAAPNLWAWYGAWTVLGVGLSASLYDAAFASIGRLLGRDSRGAITGVTLMGGFASSLGFPMGTWLSGHAGWRAAVLIYAAIQVAIILPALLAGVPGGRPPPPPPSPSRPADGPPPGRRDFVLLAVYFTTRSGIGALVSIHALILLRGLGLSLDHAVAVATLIGPAQVGARIVDFRFGRGLSPVTSARLGAALLPIGIALTLGGAPAAAFALCYGLSNGILTINRGTLPMHVFGAAGYATLLGRLALPNQIAQALIPTLVAPLVERAPSWTFAGVGAAALLALVCLLPLRR